MLKAVNCTQYLSRRWIGCSKISSKLEDYDVVINPNSQLFEKFMIEHGSKRMDFKAEDYNTWKSSWENKYRLGLFFLKGTENLVFSFHTIQYESRGFQPNFRHLGMAWIPEKYRGKEILKVVTDYLIEEEDMKKHNMLACNVHWSQNFWKQATGRSDTSSCTYYISHYDMPEFRIPATPKMTGNGVVVKRVNTEIVSDVLKYDRAIFPFDREKWMKSLFLDGIGRIAYDSNGRVIGVGCLSIYPSGECVISPLYADDKTVAQLIFRSILEEVLERNDKLWRIQVRSNDQCRDSFEWIEPFLKCSVRRTHLSNLCYSIYPPRHFFNFSKVYVNAHPTNGPC
ncbi:hypothetical protein GCK72_006144 [Caenorhabditis remanei]|uniref:DUF1248 domain-containing protein n=1 Tax=Caenorhabditis remanei TaxID=31234 RepID=A0A6A5HEI7_CAERE|nr:hypothetical protein GCK72_006144 [Caenorhabditis remanei]KAF1766188.1 hypothetical protein GCK72_006144 [Caenorhabditis remanei]